MSIYNALYGRDGHGVGPNEPEKKGFARFCQMVGRDLGQLLGTNLMVCVLCLPAALGVSLGVTLLSLPLTVVCSAVTGLLTGPAMVLLADCALRSLQNDPSQWLPRAKQTLAAHWKAACGFGCIGTLVLGKRFALPNAEIMIHQPLIGGQGGGLSGQTTDIKIHAEHMVYIRDKMNRMLSEYTGQPLEKLQLDTERDNYMSAQQAKEYGLIDDILYKH